jgi:hypothetical protein
MVKIKITKRRNSKKRLIGDYLDTIFPIKNRENEIEKEWNYIQNISKEINIRFNEEKNNFTKSISKWFSNKIKNENDNDNEEINIEKRIKNISSFILNNHYHKKIESLKNDYIFYDDIVDLKAIVDEKIVCSSREVKVKNKPYLLKFWIYHRFHYSYKTYKYPFIDPLIQRWPYLWIALFGHPDIHFSNWFKANQFNMKFNDFINKYVFIVTLRLDYRNNIDQILVQIIDKNKILFINNNDDKKKINSVNILFITPIIYSHNRLENM